LTHQAFLEMDSHQEAVDMVNYYKKHPAKLNGRQITLYLSKELLVIEVNGPLSVYSIWAFKLISRHIYPKQ